MDKRLSLRFTWPSPPPFDASLGDRVPRERRYEPSGASSSSSGLVRLTLGPGASLPQDLVEDPSVAHISVANYTGYAVMYSADRTMTINDRSTRYQVEQVACPHFELQPGMPLDRCVSIHLPRTDLGKEDISQSTQNGLNELRFANSGVPVPVGS